MSVYLQVVSASTQPVIGNYVEQMGLGGNDSLTEYLRLYIALHGDHEGGNVSAHTARKYIPAGQCTLV